MAVFVRGPVNAAWRREQLSPNQAFADRELLGGAFTSNLCVSCNADGRLELFGRGGDNGLWHNWQTAPGGDDWAGWQPLGGHVTSDPISRVYSDGRIVVFVRGPDNAVWFRLQRTRNGPFEDWRSLGDCDEQRKFGPKRRWPVGAVRSGRRQCDLASMAGAAGRRVGQKGVCKRPVQCGIAAHASAGFTAAVTAAAVAALWAVDGRAELPSTHADSSISLERDEAEAELTWGSTVCVDLIHPCWLGEVKPTVTFSSA